MGPAPFDAQLSDEASRFREGIELFNECEWFEAHEAWEDAWRLASGPRKRFYQGLIQCAVALEHVRRGNPRGVRSVFTTALTKFEGLPGVYMGVAVTELLAAMRALLQPVLDLPSTAFEPGRPHGVDLGVDLSRAPRITLPEETGPLE